MEPDNALYDAACDLLSAARRMDRAVRPDGVEPAIPATLACLHETLAALTSACAALSTNDPPGRNEPLEDLVLVLRRAAAACDAARARSGEHALYAKRDCRRG
jgi:hypothetical protein